MGAQFNFWYSHSKFVSLVKYRRRHRVHGKRCCCINGTTIGWTAKWYCPKPLPHLMHSRQTFRVLYSLYVLSPKTFSLELSVTCLEKFQSLQFCLRWYPLSRWFWWLVGPGLMAFTLWLSIWLIHLDASAWGTVERKSQGWFQFTSPDEVEVQSRIGLILDFHVKKSSLSWIWMHAIKAWNSVCVALLRK